MFLILEFLVNGINSIFDMLNRPIFVDFDISYLHFLLVSIFIGMLFRVLFGGIDMSGKRISLFHSKSSSSNDNLSSRVYHQPYKKLEDYNWLDGE